MIYDQSGNAGDLKKFEVKIDGEDVSEAVISADLYQDIFTPTWTAQVFFNDTTNLLAKLPIKAGKKITVKIETDYGGSVGDGEKEFEFIIYRVGDKVNQNHMQQTYTVFAADRSFLTNQTKRVRRSFKNQKHSSIVTQIVTEELDGGVDADPSDNNVSLIVPNWTPFNAIGWLSKVATHNKAADYCFFQIDDGKFAYRSFEKMYSSKENSIGITFVQRPEGIRENGEMDDDFTLHIQKYEVQHFDGVSNMSSGFYKSQTVSFDFNSKQWTKKIFSFGDDSPEDAAAKNWEEFMAAEDTNISFSPKHPGMFGAGSSVLDFADEWMGSRKSSIQKMDMEKLVIQIPGAVAAWQWVGRNCLVDLPSQDAFESESLDKYRKGKYVIVAICHNVRKDVYSVNLELVKKRLEE